MLVLSRKLGESIRCALGDVVTTVHVIEMRGDKVRLGIVAPRDVKVMRSELLDELELDSTLLDFSAQPEDLQAVGA